MGKFSAIEGHPNLVKDTRSGAVLNINKNEIENAKKLKQQRKIKNQEQEQLKQDVADLKNDMAGIRQLLVQIVEKFK